MRGLRAEGCGLMWHWLAFATCPALAHELEVTKDRLREAEA